MEQQTQKTPPPKTGTGNGKGTSLPKVKLTAKNSGDVAVITLYTIQTVGEMSLKELRLKLQSMFNVHIHPSTLKNSVRALRAKDLLSIGYRDDGTDVYKVAKLKFMHSTTELAHVKNVTEMLTALKDDPAGQALLALLGEAEASANASTTKGRTYPRDWHLFKVKIKLITPMLGAHPAVGQLKADYVQSSHKDDKLDLTTEPLVFDRGPEGELVIGKNCVAGFISMGLPALHIPYTSIDLWRFSDVLVKPKKVTALCLPVLVGQATGRKGTNQGAGMKWYEAIPAGEEIEIKFLAPTTNYLDPEKLKQFLEVAFEFNKRSISPARGSQFGTAKLVSFEHTLVPWIEESDESDEEA